MLQEVLLDPSQEMKAYRAALSRNNAGKQKNASRRLPVGPASDGIGKINGKKRRNNSGSSSRPAKKSPKKKDDTIRFRRPSDEVDAEELNRRVSDVSIEEPTEASEAEKAARRVFKKPVLEAYLERMKNKSEAEKKAFKDALHSLIVLVLGDS